MTMPGGGQYLPPIVTRLLGDASDLLRAFAEAKAAQDAFTKSSTTMSEKVKANTKTTGRDVDDFTSLVVRKMHTAESAAQVLKRRLAEVGDEVANLRRRVASEGANQGLTADFRKAADELKRLKTLAQELAPDLLNGGNKGGKSFIAGFIESFSQIGSMIVPILVGAVILASPAIAALIGSAVAVGFGLGFIGVGAFAAAMLLPKIKSQFIAMGREAKNALLFGITGAFDEALRSGLLTFRVYVRQWGPILRSIFDALAPQVRFLFDALGGGVGELLTAFAAIAKQISAPGGPLETFIATIPMVFQAVGDFLTKITADGPALSRFIYDAANAISGFLEGAGDVIAWLEGVYLWAVKLNEKLPFIGWANTVNGIKVTLKELGDFFPWLWGQIVEKGKAVGAWFANLGKSIWNWLKSAGKAVGDWVMGVVHWFAGLGPRIIRFIQSIPGRVAAFFSQMAHQAAYWFGFLVGSAVRILLTLPGKILNIILTVWAWTVQRTKEGVDAVIAFVAALPGRIAAFFAMLWTAVTAWVAKTWVSVVTWFVRTKQSIIEHVAAAITAAIAFFKGLPGRATTELKTFKEKVAAFFSGAKDWLVEAGKDIVRGLVDGVTGMWDWAVGKLKGLAHDLIKGFKGGIESNSPSKAFAREGRNSALGYIQGWNQMIGRVQDAVSGGRTMDVVMSYPSGGNPRPPAPPPGDPRGAAMVHTVVKIGDRAVVDAITPASQRRGMRSGITGIGAPTARII